jgi:hypothetical protein
MTDRATRRLLAALACGSCRVCAQTCALGSGLTHCPAHADQTASLNVTQGSDRLLLKCHAGCSQAAVIDALRARDLWDRRTTYDYRDADGTLLYQAVRLEIPGQEKTFYHQLLAALSDSLEPSSMQARVLHALSACRRATVHWRSGSRT